MYQNAMTIIFKEILGDTVECYVDYWIVKSLQMVDHLRHLKMVYEKLRLHQLKMNPLKCAFGVTLKQVPMVYCLPRGNQS